MKTTTPPIPWGVSAFKLRTERESREHLQYLHNVLCCQTKKKVSFHLVLLPNFLLEHSLIYPKICYAYISTNYSSHLYLMYVSILGFPQRQYSSLLCLFCIRLCNYCTPVRIHVFLKNFLSYKETSFLLSSFVTDRISHA